MLAKISERRLAMRKFGVLSLILISVFVLGCVQTTGKITLMTDPSGATVYLDGNQLNDKTPLTFDYNFKDDGVKIVTIKLDGYYTLEEPLNWGWIHYETAKGNATKNVKIKEEDKEKKIWTINTRRKLFKKP